MEVTRVDFAHRLPTILKHISEAHFLSFDLELSGIPDQKRHRGAGPKSLAERYKELKHAAETYHILQVGLTCVEEDQANARYLIRSYNFNISPLVDDQLELERKFTYSTGAVDFLLRHGYKMESPFQVGIPYLTRAETEPAMKTALARWDTQAVPDITVKPDDVKALAFIKRVRQEVGEWQAIKSRGKDAHYNITGLPDGKSKGIVATLNRFEKRLTHQVIRAEYPSLQTSSRADGVQVKARDKEEQQRIQESLHHRLRSTIFNQVGFRWVAEAMAGGDLSGLDSAALGYIRGEAEPNSIESFEHRLDSLRKSLKERRKVLVGHNCLLDLIYFFKTFYGPLPDSVEEFQQQLHGLFPLIIDTKYLSTNPGSSDALRFRNSQLWQVEQALGELNVPDFAEPKDHASYQDSKQYHQAGFDSYVTAKVFLKLATKIASEHPQTWVLASPVQQPSLVSGHLNTVLKPGVKKEKEYSPPMNKQTSRKVFHANSFSSLADLEDDDRGGVDLPAAAAADIPAATPAVDLGSNPGTRDGDDSKQQAYSVHPLRLKEDTEIGSKQGLLPRWDAPFWIEFGNKIRVYGTVEEQCDITKVKLGCEARKSANVEGDVTEELASTRPFLDGLMGAVGKLF